MNRFRVIHRFAVLLVICCSSCLWTTAQNYCTAKAVGYGENATGGGSASPVLVSSVSELGSALSSSGSKVIVITENLAFTSCLKVKAVNKTLLALPGVVLSSSKQDKNNSGILYFQSGSENVIIRNLTFVGPGAYDCDGLDNLCFDGVKRAWVDHCDFQDGCDGNFDNKGNTDNITVSWCRFRYLKEPKAGGPGGSDDHRFTNLIGSSSSDKPVDGTYNMTWAYCWWDEGCVERMTRCRNASLHFLDCYWNSSVAHCYVGPENADCFFEGCTFEGAPAKKKIFYENYKGTNGSKFVDCVASKGVPSDVTNRKVTVPAYAYSSLGAAEAKAAVTNPTCGAGATLSVTTQGRVSSSCDGDTPNPPDPPDPVLSDTVMESVFWNFSDADFAGLGTIQDETVVRKLHMLATSEKTMTINGNVAVCDDVAFTHCLKLGGGGAAAYRQVYFTVKGDCRIEVYLVSSGATERTLNLCAGDFGQVLSSFTATTVLHKETCTYSGVAATLRLYSAGSGINLYGIRLIYGNDGTSVPVVRQQKTGKRYNVLGLPVDDTYHGWVIMDGEKHWQP